MPTDKLASLVGSLVPQSKVGTTFGAHPRTRHVSAGSPATQSTAVAPMPTWVKAIAGMCGGLVEACSLQPLDVAKTRLQLDNQGKYRGLVHTVRTIAAEEGMGALYKGLTPFVTHLTVKYALRFGAFGYFKAMLPKNEDGTSPMYMDFLAGLGSGVTEAIIVVTPFEVVKIRLQKQVGMDKSKMKYKGPIHTAMTVIKEEGPAALWKGCVPTMVRQGSNQAFNFMSFYAINEYLYGKRDGDDKPLAWWKASSTALIAASIGPICNCPMDVLKTRFMAQEQAGAARKYTSVVQAIRVIAKEEGVAALWKGLIPRLARLAPGQAITWTVVTRVQYFFEKKMRDEDNGSKWTSPKADE